MKRFFCLTLMFLFICAECLAFSKTAILRKTVENKGSLPFIDGLPSISIQKQANSLINTTVDKLRAETGGNARVSYQIFLNKPTLVSMLFTAAGSRGIRCQGLTIDLTSGTPVPSSDFFYLKDKFREIVPHDDFVYTEKTLLLRDKDGKYSRMIPYTQLLPYINIANGGRVLASYRLTKEGSGKLMELNTNEMVAIFLDSNPSTGYDWHMTQGKKLEGLVDMGSSFFMPVKNDPRMTGVGGMTIHVLSFSLPGTYRVEYEYARPFEKAKKTEKVFYTFEVY